MTRPAGCPAGPLAHACLIRDRCAFGVFTDPIPASGKAS
ncbi:hypothetical protein C7S14_6674 [Burkholderia cepacia]|nr:hypothetical protein C7S14_6674 [Burkholderia cepacia]